MKKNLLVLLIAMSSIANSWAQYAVKLDSLKHVLPQVSGKEKVVVLRDLCYYSRGIDFDEAVSYGEEAIAYATEISHNPQLGSAYQDLGSVYVYAGRPETALEYYKKAQAIFDETKDKKNQGAVLHNMGVVYSSKSDFTAAIAHFHQSLAIKRSFGGTKAGLSLNSLGEVYRNKREYDKALEYYQKALKESEKEKNKGDIAMAYGNIGLVHRLKGDYDKALAYRKKAIALQTEIGDNRRLAISYNNLGEFYHLQGNLVEAITYFEKSLAIKSSLNNQHGIAHTSEKLAMVFSEQGDFESADQMAQTSLAIAKEIGSPLKQMDVVLSLSKIYQTFGKYQQALLYHQQYALLKDSIFNETKEVILSDMETKYKTQKKASENALLKLEAKQQIATIAQQNRLVTVFIIGLLILMGLSALLFKAYRQKNNSNRLLATQKEALTKLDATKNRFFGIIAHDLRGPLTALQGISGLLNYHIKKGNTALLNKIALQIEDSAQNVNTLLDNLLNWALSQQGAIPYHPQRLALQPMIQESLHFFKDMAAAKDIELTADIPNALHVHADKETLSTVFRNLINNSIKFTPKGGIINLLAEDSQENVTLTIQDNGTGIASDRLDKLFMLNDHNSTSCTRSEKGSGLGLVLVNDFVRMNKGTITVSSKLNEGSVFSVTLPSK